MPAILLIFTLLFLGPAAVAAQPAPLPARVVLEDRLAASLRVAPGDTVHIRMTGERGAGTPFLVEGTHTPPPDPAAIGRTSRTVWVPITDLENLSGRRDRVSRFVIGLAPGADAGAVVAALNDYEMGFRAYRAADVAAQSSETFVVISNFHKAISFLSILAGSAFLAAIVLLQVQELRKSLGVLRVLGFSKGRIYLAVVGETVLLANAGAAIGVALALLVSRGVNLYYRRYFDTDLVFSAVTGTHVALAFGIATTVGMLVGSLAMVYLLRLQVNEVLGR
ncbi:MAG TPA: ABC transporter permease [Candidatus Krumholzibacteria bacterium]|nr:ABC transporter permease [Candidatus Krumholzibacteria bacterium]